MEFKLHAPFKPTGDQPEAIEKLAQGVKMGLDEKFAVAFNDVDFCLRVRDRGYRIAWTPYAQLTHYESKSR